MSKLGAGIRRALCLLGVGLLGAGLLGTGCGRPARPAAALSQTGGGITVTLTCSPSPPHTGDNTLTLTVTDTTTGAPIPNANILAEADMVSPRLPGGGVSGRAQGNGVYQVPVRLIAARYEIVIQIQRPSHPPVTLSFPLEAS